MNDSFSEGGVFYGRAAVYTAVALVLALALQLVR